MRLNRNTRIGLALLGVAALLYIAYLAFGRSAVTPPPPVVENPGTVRRVSVPSGGMVAVAREDIPERTILSEDMLRMQPLPADVANSDYISDLGSQGAGYITQRPILRDEPVRRSDLVGHISKVGIAAAVRPGLRAMAVPILNKATLHDLVHVGDYVDIIASFDQQESRTIVQNVRVLAVDVFGKNQQKIAARGDYRADPSAPGPDTANTPSPAGATGAPTNAPPPQAAAPAPTPAPTPAPATGSAPPPKPEPSLTLEVSPEQATSLSLAQASSAPLDFILRPRTPEAVPLGSGGRVVAGTTTVTRVVAMTKPRLAPFAAAYKNAGRGAAASGAGTRTTGTSSGGGSKNGGGGGGIGSGPGNPPGNIPPPISVGKGIPPLTIPREPETYKIPIYGDGKVIREDTVLKPPS